MNNVKENENKVLISEELVRKSIILLAILGLVILLMQFAIIRLQMSDLYLDSVMSSYKETMELQNFIRFKLPYFRFN